MPKLRPKTQKSSSLKVIVGMIVFVLVTLGLIAGTYLSQQTQNLESDASVKGGIAQIQFEPSRDLVEVNKVTTVPVTLNTNSALIDGAQISIRIKGVKVKDVKFVPSQSPLTVSQNNVGQDKDQSKVDVVFLSPSNQPISIPGRVTLGEITFTPIGSGRIELSFDSAFSKVTTHVATSSTPTPSPIAVATPNTGEAVPTTQDSQPTVPKSALVRDILQTPSNVYLSVVVSDPVRPSSSPLQGCNSDASCPKGYICYQPPMPSCPQGSACTQVMPSRYCRPAASPKPPQTSCVSNADCAPNHRCANGTCLSVIVPTPVPSPSIQATPIPSPVSYQAGDLNRDNVVNILDLSILTKSLLKTGDSEADLNKDGIVDILDYSTMLTYIR